MRTTTPPQPSTLVFSSGTALLLSVLAACGSTDLNDDVTSAPEAWIEAGEGEYVPAKEDEVTTPEVIVPETSKEPPVVKEPTMKEDPGMRSGEVVGEVLPGCELEQLWWRDDTHQQLTASSFGWSPDQSVLIGAQQNYLSSWTVLRARDGEQMLYNGWPMEIVDVDRDWRHAIVRRPNEVSGTSLEVMELETGRTLMALDEYVQPGYQFDLSGDGEVLVGLRCEMHDDGSSTRTLDFWYPSGSGSWVTGYEQHEESGCSWWDSYSSNLSVNHDGSIVAVAHTPDPYARLEGEDPVWEGPRLEIFNRRSDHLIRREVQLEDVTQPDDLRRLDKVILAQMAFHPDQESLSLVNLEGTHYLVDTREEELPVTKGTQRGAFVSNWNSYLPEIPSSPMAWSKDGQMFASVNVGGEVEISSWPETSNVRHVIRAPELSQEQGRFFPEGAVNAPVNVAFSPDEKLVTVAFTVGVGVWGCAKDVVTKPAEPEVQPLQVELETSAPISGKVYGFKSITYEEAARSSYVKAMRVVVNGEVRQLLNMSHEIEPQFRLYEAGSHEVYFEVDDGVSLWRSEPQQVNVLPPR